jgi:hypothetical protein
MPSLRKLYRKLRSRILFFFRPTEEPNFDLVDPPQQDDLEEPELHPPKLTDEFGLDLVEPPQEVDREEYELDLVHSSQQDDLEEPELDLFPEAHHFSPEEREHVWYHQCQHSNVEVTCCVLPPGYPLGSL